MKRIFGMAIVLLILLFCAPFAFADDWTAITDEIDVDLSTNIVRVYAVVKKDSGYDRKAKDQARKTLLAYIDTLTTGKERAPLKDEFAKRQALYGKVQHIVERNLQYGEETDLPATGQYSRYYLFDLKLLTQLLPNFNFPSKEDAL